MNRGTRRGIGGAIFGLLGTAVLPLFDLVQRKPCLPPWSFDLVPEPLACLFLAPGMMVARSITNPSFNADGSLPCWYWLGLAIGFALNTCVWAAIFRGIGMLWDRRPRLVLIAALAALACTIVGLCIVWMVVPRIEGRP